MKTIEVTVRRRIEVPDDKLLYNEWYREKGIDRVETTTTVEPFLGDGETLTDAHVIGSVVLAPDPGETLTYQAVLTAHARAKTERDMKLLAGVAPDDLPTDEELTDEYFAEPPEPVPACSECGSTTFRYDENVGASWSFAEAKIDVEADEGTLEFYGSSNYFEGDSYPGLVCDNCGVALETHFEIEFH